MKTGICNIAFIPMRAEASHRSEMTSQLVFGEVYSIIEETNGWLHVKNSFDSYKGWIDASQAIIISKEEYERYSNEQMKFPSEVISTIDVDQKNMQFPFPFGSILYGKEFEINGLKYSYKGNLIKTENNIRTQVVSMAMKFLNTPYIWGGRTALGIDCSGLTQTLFRVVGIDLMRDASQQTTHGKDVGFIDEAKEGDLAFFGDEENITHVGIILKDEKIIHASGKVRIDKLDHHGIFNLETKKYTHNLRLIKNVID